MNLFIFPKNNTSKAKLIGGNSSCIKIILTATFDNPIKIDNIGNIIFNQQSISYGTGNDIKFNHGKIELKDGWYYGNFNLYLNTDQSDNHYHIVWIKSSDQYLILPGKNLIRNGNIINYNGLFFIDHEQTGDSIGIQMYFENQPTILILSEISDIEIDIIKLK